MLNGQRLGIRFNNISQTTYAFTHTPVYPDSAYIKLVLAVNVRDEHTASPQWTELKQLN